MKLVEFLTPDFEFVNENGLLVQLVDNGWKQVNVILSKSGKVRGGHYHKYNKEAFYVVSGEFKLTVWNTDCMEEYVMKPKDFFLINEYAYHRFEYKEDTILLSMYNNGVVLGNENKDIWNE